jgi:hypothetical protein
MASTNDSIPLAQDSAGANDAPYSTNPPNSPPPSKQSLNHWWKAFSKKNKKEEEKGKLPPTSLESGTGGDGVYTLSSQSLSEIPGLPVDEGSWAPSMLEQPTLHPNHNGAAQAFSSNSLPIAIPNNNSDLKAHRGDSPGIRRLSNQASRDTRGPSGHLSFLGIKDTFTSPLLPNASKQPMERSFTDPFHTAARGAAQGPTGGTFDSYTRDQFQRIPTYFTPGIIPNPSGIFGVPLQVSIKYANVAISLTDNEGKSFIYGYVPIVVAKCGVFLKEQGRSRVLSDNPALIDLCSN